LPATAFLSNASNVTNGDSAVVDDDLEEFLPSSLNELLTPGERSRRMSRTNSGRPTFSDSQPRFVNSVPSANLFNNIRGLWDDATTSEGTTGASTQRPSIARESWSRKNDGLPGSVGADLPSPSFLGTSNASAAFLSGHHIHRTNGAVPDGIQSSQFNVSSSFDALANPNFAPQADVAFSPPRLGSGLVNSHSQGIFMPNDSSYYGLHPHQHQARPLGDAPRPHMALSPSSRALRSHEPGQSLPQGLAAGLSRLHLIPATNPVSPPPMSGGSPHDGFQQQQASWLRSPPATGTSPGSVGIASPPRTSGIGGFSTISGGNGPSPSSITISSSAAPLRRPWITQATSSPLSRPTVPDDDAMFTMDEEP